MFFRKAKRISESEIKVYSYLLAYHKKCVLIFLQRMEFAEAQRKIIERNFEGLKVRFCFGFWLYY